MEHSPHLVGPGLSHLVLNVRDLDRSHVFYTAMLGFEQCGELEPGSTIGRMRFYRGDPSHHHHIALVQTLESAEPPTPWAMNRTTVGINHIALNYPSREAFLARVQHLVDNNVEIAQRGNHGMTHSAYVEDPDGNGIEVLYDVPQTAWEGDVNAALNYWEPLPREGQEALVDTTDYVKF
jgi:catechol 2,3-dioxygenase